MAPHGVSYDVAVVMLTALHRVCVADPKAGRRARKEAIRQIAGMVIARPLREEAIRNVSAGCDACRACKGV